jgi:hypothetical protein
MHGRALAEADELPPRGFSVDVLGHGCSVSNPLLPAAAGDDLLIAASHLLTPQRAVPLPFALRNKVLCALWEVGCIVMQSDQAIKKYTRVERGNFEVAVTSPPSPSRRMSNINIDIEHQRYRPHVVIRSIQARPREDALDSVLED